MKPTTTYEEDIATAKEIGRKADEMEKAGQYGAAAHKRNVRDSIRFRARNKRPKTLSK